LLGITFLLDVVQLTIVFDFSIFLIILYRFVWVAPQPWRKGELILFFFARSSSIFFNDLVPLFAYLFRFNFVF